MWSARTTRSPLRYSRLIPPVAAVRISVVQPEPGEDAGREGDGGEVVPLVVVDTALEHRHGRPAEPAGDEVAGVALDRRVREVGDRGVGDARRGLDEVGQVAQARAEDDPDAWGLGDAAGRRWRPR